MENVTLTHECPGCGGSQFEGFQGRTNARCTTCGAFERTRAAYLFIKRHIRPQRGWKVLHLAPDEGLGEYLHQLVGESYQPVDINPPRYARNVSCPVQKFDMCQDAEKLPSDYYDLVIHNHVLEHIPCNYTIALQHLHRSIRPGGFHLFSVPMSAPYYSEDLTPTLTPEERQQRFYQYDHVRMFGRKDFNQTLGAVLGLTDKYTLLDFFSAEELRRANIPESGWRLSGHAPFLVQKQA